MKVVFPDKYSFDQLFTFSGLEGRTDYANMLTLLSQKERFTYWPMLPVRSGSIRIPDFDGPIVVCSDFASFGPNRMLLADAWNLLIDGEATLNGFDDGAYEIVRVDRRILLAPNGFLHTEFLTADFNALLEKKQRAFDVLQSFPDMESDERAKAVVRACAVLRSCVYSPEEKFRHLWVTPDRWPHRHCWIMDSVYQALGLQYFDKRAACDAICALFDHQEPCGKVPMTVFPGYAAPAMIQQPVIANGLKAIDAPDDVIEFALPHLTAFIDWVLQHRDLDGDGILEWMTLGYDKLCPCGESGMDNSPRFDGGRICGAVDLTCFISRECEVIAEFAQRLGKADVGEKYTDIHERLNSLIENKLWNDDMEFYSDFDVISRKPTMVSAVSGFLPLLCGAASKEHAARLAAHVLNPKTYGTFYPLPSVSVSDPRFELDMWRGPVWHIFNYHVAEGLDRYGFHSEAEHIRRKTVEAGLRYYNEFGGFFEFYDPFGELPPGRINRKGQNIPEGEEWLHRAVHDYGWSAAVFLDMLHKLKRQ